MDELFRQRVKLLPPPHLEDFYESLSYTVSSFWSFLETIIDYWNYNCHGDLEIGALLSRSGSSLMNVTLWSPHNAHALKFSIPKFDRTILPPAVLKMELEAAYFFFMSPVSSMFHLHLLVTGIEMQ